MAAGAVAEAVSARVYRAGYVRCQVDGRVLQLGWCGMMGWRGIQASGAATHIGEGRSWRSRGFGSAGGAVVLLKDGRGELGWGFEGEVVGTGSRDDEVVGGTGGGGIRCGFGRERRGRILWENGGCEAMAARAMADRAWWLRCSCISVGTRAARRGWGEGGDRRWRAEQVTLGADGAGSRETTQTEALFFHAGAAGGEEISVCVEPLERARRTC